jgi:N-acetylglucosamine-6-phosphate deacetylase
MAKKTIKALSYKDGKPVSLEITDGMISGVEQITAGEVSSGFYIAPGLIDIQINGYMGVDFAGQDLTVEKVKEVTRSLWKVGVTAYLPTLISANKESLLNSFSVLAQAAEDTTISSSIPGFHLEGPYISPVSGFRGAHLEKYIRKPDWNEFQELAEASKNRIRLVTLAPETEGAVPFIRKCDGEGITTALGHHNGSASEINAAVYAGAVLSTHLGNGCANTIDRHKNSFWPQLANDGLSISIIADGSHLSKEEILTFFKIKGPGKTILISDNVDLAGLTPGEYFRGGRKILLTADVVKYPEENVLAGAVATLADGLTNMMTITGCSLAEAIQMSSTNPARLVGLHDRGEMKPGKRADLILFSLENDKIRIEKTLVAGTEVYSRF